MLNNTMIPSIIAVLRARLPVEELSDAEIGLGLNFTFLAAAFVLHIATRIFSGQKDQLGFDRRAFHNTATENRRLQVDLAKKDKEIQRLSKQSEELEQRAGALEEEGNKNKERMAELEEEMNCEMEKYESLKADYETASESLSKAKTVLVTLKEGLEEAENAQQDALRQLRQSEDEVYKLQIEIEDKKTEKHHLTSQLEQAGKALRVKETERRDLELQLSGMSVLLGEMNRDGKEKSNGWSDIDDEIPAAEIRELAKLRTELTRLEKEHEKSLLSLERLHDEKQRLQVQIQDQKTELESKTKEIEARDADRRGADDRVSQLLSLVQENNGKIKDKETTCDKLSAKIEQLQADLASLNDDMRAKENKFKCLDEEVKRWRNDYYKLEAMSFSKEAEYRRQLQSLQSYSQKMMPRAPSYDLPVNSSLDTSLPTRTEHRGSMWDLPDNGSNKVVSSPEDDQMSTMMSSVVGKSKSGRSRRSDRVTSFEKSGMERKRSHSQGRNRNDNYMMMPFHPLNRM